MQKHSKKKNRNRFSRGIAVGTAIALTLTVPAYADRQAAAEPAAIVEPEQALEVCRTATPVVVIIETENVTDAGAEGQPVYDVSEAPQALYDAAAAEQTESPAAEESTETVEEPVLLTLNSSETEQESSSSESAASISETAGGSLQVGGTTLGTDAENIGWDGESGWRYDGSTVSLVNNGTAVDVHAEGQGISVSAAGFNRIGTLYADGDVDITGTGILLIDNIDMLEGTCLNLKTNTDMYADGDGSVAVFVLNSEDGCYYLVNGDVTGILDDDITISGGLTLVVPADGELALRVTDLVVKIVRDAEGALLSEELLSYGLNEAYDEIGNRWETQADGTKTRQESRVSVPHVTLKEGSKLTVKNGGKIKMDSTQNPIVEAGESTVATLTVEGVLELDGTITGAHEHDAIPEVLVTGNGSISGVGILEAVDVHYKDINETDDVIHTGDQTRVIVEQQGPGICAEKGTTTVICRNGAALGALEVAGAETATGNGSTLIIEVSVPLKGVETGTEPVVYEGGTLVTPVGGLSVDGNAYGNNAATAADALAAAAESEQTVRTVSVSDVYYRTIGSAPGISGSNYGGKYSYSVQEASVTGSGELHLTRGESIGFSTLEERLATKSIPDYLQSAYIVYCLRDGKVIPVQLDEKSTDTVNADEIVSVTALTCSFESATAPATGSVGNATGNTGTGILGGENAGSLTGVRAPACCQAAVSLQHRLNRRSP